MICMMQKYKTVFIHLTCVLIQYPDQMQDKAAIDNRIFRKNTIFTQNVETMHLLFFLAAALSLTGIGHQSPELSIKDNTIFCGECELVKLTDFEVCYTLPSEDITKGEKEFTSAFADHRPAFEASGNGLYEKETQSSMTLSRTRYGLEINVKSTLNNFSEYGVSIPFNFMGKLKRGGWRKQYVVNNVFRSTDGKILYAYLTSPSGCNICVAAMNNLAGWKADFPSYSCHYFEKLCLYANFDRAYGPRERENEVSFQIFPVKDYDDLLGKLSKILDIPFLDVDKTGGKIGSRVKLIPYGKIDSVRIVNDFSKTCKTIPFQNEIEIEYESDTYLYPVRCRKGEAVVGGEAEIYGYADIIDTYRKTMDRVNLFRVFHRKNFEFDGNLCEHQCWMSAGLRFLMKYGDRMNADEKRRLTNKLNCLLDLITEPDSVNAIKRVTILNTPYAEYPAYNVFGDDRFQEEAFGMTILLDAYKYFGDRLYYDYLINTMDSFLNTYQKEDGSLRRFSGEDYSTVCCLIIPIIDVANFLADKDKARSDRYMESARKMAWHICRRGAVFPTEGAGNRDPEDQEMEDGSISCSALSLLYYCDNVEYVPEFITAAKEILDLHETWVMRSSSCGSKCSSLRWWETCWEGDQNGPAFCAGHAWTIWRAEGDWLYYKLTGDEKYYIKAFNGFMTNISKIRPDGNTYAIRNIDMIPGGGFYTDAECTVFRLQNKFPDTYDSGLSRYMWIRANDSILDHLISGEGAPKAASN